MRRRDLLTAAAGTVLACPAWAQPAAARILVSIPQANLTSLDPVWTTATITRSYACMVFDTLYGTIDSTDPAERRRLAAAIQQEAFTDALFVLLGQHSQSAAWRSNLSGHLKAQPPLFWNVSKA